MVILLAIMHFLEWGKRSVEKEGMNDHVPSCLLIYAPSSICDLLVGVAIHCVACFLLEEIETWMVRVGLVYF